MIVHRPGRTADNNVLVALCHSCCTPKSILCFLLAFVRLEACRHSGFRPAEAFLPDRMRDLGLWLGRTKICYATIPQQSTVFTLESAYHQKDSIDHVSAHHLTSEPHLSVTEHAISLSASTFCTKCSSVKQPYRPTTACHLLYLCTAPVCAAWKHMWRTFSTFAHRSISGSTNGAQSQSLIRQRNNREKSKRHTTT